VRRLGLSAFGLAVACGAFEPGSEVQSPAPGADAGPPADAGTSSGGPGPTPGPAEDAGPDLDGAKPGKTPRIVQQNGVYRASTGSGGTLTVALDSAVAAGDLVIVSIVDTKGGAAPVVDVEDNNGRQLAQVIQAVNGLSASAEIWWNTSPGGLTSVTIKTGALNTPLAVWVFEAEGVSAPAADPQAASAQPATNGVAAAPLMSVTAPALVVSTIAHGGQVGAIVAGNEFLELDIDTTEPITYGTAYRAVSQSGSYGANWMAESGVAFNACTAAFTP
jgi:hypothetical protein